MIAFKTILSFCILFILTSCIDESTDTDGEASGLVYISFYLSWQQNWEDDIGLHRSFHIDAALQNDPGDFAQKFSALAK